MKLRHLLTATFVLANLLLPACTPPANPEPEPTDDGVRRLDYTAYKIIEIGVTSNPDLCDNARDQGAVVIIRLNGGTISIAPDPSGSERATIVLDPPDFVALEKVQDGWMEREDYLYLVLEDYAKKTAYIDVANCEAPDRFRIH